MVLMSEQGPSASGGGEVSSMNRQELLAVIANLEEQYEQCCDSLKFLNDLKVVGLKRNQVLELGVNEESSVFVVDFDLVKVKRDKKANLQRMLNRSLDLLKKIDGKLVLLNGRIVKYFKLDNLYGQLHIIRSAFYAWKEYVMCADARFSRDRYVFGDRSFKISTLCGRCIGECSHSNLQLKRKLVSGRKSNFLHHCYLSYLLPFCAGPRDSWCRFCDVNSIIYSLE